MKKIMIAGLMAVMMTMSLAACGSSAGSSDASGTGSAATGDNSAAQAASGDKVTLSLCWWGNQTRNDVTKKAVDLYMEQNPNVEIKVEFTDWSGYWDKLSAMAAGGNLPDIIQMDYSYLQQYQQSGQLADLSQFIESGVIDTSKIADSVIDSGSIDGTCYALSLGSNAPMMVYDKEIVEQAGVELPEQLTIEELYDIGQTIYEKTGVKTDIAYGIAQSWSEYFMRSYDIVPFGDKCMNGDETSWTPFFEMYTKGLDEGWLLDPSVFAEIAIGSVEQAPMVYSQTPETQSWCEFSNSNQLTAMQKAAPEGTEIGITTWPAPDPKKSDYLKSSQFFSVGSDAKNPEEAVKLLNWLINSSEANNILLGERGIPAPANIAEEVAPQISEVDQKVVAFINDVVTPNCSPINPPQPDGASEVYDLLNRTVEKVCYGELDAPTAASQFWTEANKIMSTK